MGWHDCEYLTRDEAKALGFTYADLAKSSGDVTLSYSSGRSWIMPDMALLYVELGWVPPVGFIEDVMKSNLTEQKRAQTRSMSAKPERIGYLSPSTDSLPQPFKIAAILPEGFLNKMAEQMGHAKNLSANVDPKTDELNALIAKVKPRPIFRGKVIPS